MSTQHTPGEWTIFEGGSDLDFPGIEAGDFSIVCFGDSDDTNDMCGVRGRTLDEAWANARLFAAAPALLKELRNLRRRFHAACIHAGSDEWAATAACADADAAIAKATTP